MLHAPHEIGRSDTRSVFQGSAETERKKPVAAVSQEETDDVAKVAASSDDSALAEKVQPVSQTSNAELFLDEVARKVLGENVRLTIEPHDGSRRFIYKSMDRTTGELIKQFPPEDFLDVLARFVEYEKDARMMSGLHVDEKA